MSPEVRWRIASAEALVMLAVTSTSKAGCILFDKMRLPIPLRAAKYFGLNGLQESISILLRMPLGLALSAGEGYHGCHASDAESAFSRPAPVGGAAGAGVLPTIAGAARRLPDAGCVRCRPLRRQSQESAANGCAAIAWPIQIGCRDAICACCGPSRQIELQSAHGQMLSWPGNPELLQITAQIQSRRHLAARAAVSGLKLRRNAFCIGRHGDAFTGRPPAWPAQEAARSCCAPGWCACFGLRFIPSLASPECPPVGRAAKLEKPNALFIEEGWRRSERFCQWSFRRPD